MKHILYASTALGLLAGVAVISSPAAATVISVGACTPVALGTPCTPGAAITSSSTGTLTLASTTVGAFSIQGTAQAGVTPTSAFFDTQTLDLSTTGGLIDVYFTVQNVPTQQVPLLFTTDFTSNNQRAGTHTVIESAYENNGNTLFGLSTQLAAATLTSASNQSAGPFFTTLTPGANVSFTELYQIQLTNCGGAIGGQCSASLTIDLTAQNVTEPLSISILGVGLVGLGFARRFRQGRQAA